MKHKVVNEISTCIECSVGYFLNENTCEKGNINECEIYQNSTVCL